MLPALSLSATTKPFVFAGARAARQSVQVLPPPFEIGRWMLSPPPAGRPEAVAVVGRGRRGEPAQGAESRVGVLVIALRVLRQPGCHPAIASTACRLLAARRSAEHVELTAAVGGDLRVVGALREAG